MDPESFTAVQKITGLPLFGTIPKIKVMGNGLDGKGICIA
jgi:hypothetical protein